MGADKALKLAAGVLELLPNATYRLELENKDQVLAHAAGAANVNFVRLRPGDRVEVELTPKQEKGSRFKEQG